MRALLRASHFQPTVAVTAITTALALASGRGMGTVWVALAVLAGQLSVGLSNDYVDRDRDRSAGRRDKPIVAGEVAAGTVRRVALAAGALALALSALSGWRAALVHVGALSAAWAYNFGVKSTVASVLPYVVAFAALPAFVTLGLPRHPWPPWWAMAAGAALGAGAHFVNTVPDAEADVRAGVRGLPQVLGPRASLLLAAPLLGGAVVLLALAPPGRLPAGGVGALAAAVLSVGGVLVSALSGRARGAWSLTLVTAALAVALLLLRGAALA